MKNFSKFVDVIAKGEYNSAEVCLLLAKTDPDLFLKLVGMCEVSSAQWIAPLVHEIRHVGLVASIKMLREATGLHLKEAKETIENLMNYRIDELGERSYYLVMPKPYHTLDDQCSKIFDMVCEGFKRY